MNYSNTSSLSGITGTYVPVILGLGSNTKYNDMEPMDLLRSAIKFLGQKLTHLRYSSVYKTTAMYYENQPDFYNMAVFGFFIGSAIELLDYIQQIEAIHGRAEEMARKPQYRQQFDLCVSRAVANLCTLNEYCLPFVKTGGRFISYKASNIEEEVNESKNAIKILGGKLWDVKELELPFSDIKRTFVFIDKIKDTPKGYPRKAGTASKEPIK